MTRPVYVGVGTCECRRMDVRLYQGPGVGFARKLLCKLCLEKLNIEVPAPRTADDIETVDGELRWKKP